MAKAAASCEAKHEAFRARSKGLAVEPRFSPIFVKPNVNHFFTISVFKDRMIYHDM